MTTNTATESEPEQTYPVYASGNRRVGYVVGTDATGWEAFDRTDISIGRFDSFDDAIAAVRL